MSRPAGSAPLERIRSAFACALHMHQPTNPAGATSALISHLQWMLELPGEGDNHNAEPFAHCYRRMAERLPELIGQGCDPRIMLNYSGNLLWGFEQMGRADILGALRALACDPALIPPVEWLGSFWSHAVAPSTPIADLKPSSGCWCRSTGWKASRAPGPITPAPSTSGGGSAAGEGAGGGVAGWLSRSRLTHVTV